MGRAKGILASVMAAASFFVLAWQAGEGIQTDFPEGQWPQIRQEMDAASLSKLRVEFSKRTRAYDYSGEIQTPFLRGADYVQQNRGKIDSLTYEQVMARARPDVVGVILETRHRNQKDAESTEIALRVDGRTVQPFQDVINSDRLKVVGYYAERRYVVNRSFYFESQELKGAKSLEVLIFEPEGKTYPVEIPVGKLR